MIYQIRFGHVGCTIIDYVNATNIVKAIKEAERIQDILNDFYGEINVEIKAIVSEPELEYMLNDKK